MTAGTIVVNDWRYIARECRRLLQLDRCSATGAGGQGYPSSCDGKEQQRESAGVATP
jgi:hypothetical protein